MTAKPVSFTVYLAVYYFLSSIASRISLSFPATPSTTDTKYPPSALYGLSTVRKE